MILHYEFFIIKHSHKKETLVITIAIISVSFILPVICKSQIPTIPISIHPNLPEVQTESSLPYSLQYKEVRRVLLPESVQILVGYHDISKIASTEAYRKKYQLRQTECLPWKEPLSQVHSPVNAHLKIR